MFSPDVDRAARAQAIASFPNESCGLVVDGRYVAVPNIAAEPSRHFEMPADSWVAHGKVEGVIHSHGASDPLAPSADDMRHQIASGVPWGITRTDGVVASPVLWWGDFRLDDPLLGREFVHGVTDCYGAIRAWRWQKRQVRLIDFARDDNWWSTGFDLYREGFGQAGFVEIAAGEADVGDVVLFNIRSKVPNHGGTIVDGGLLYHHLVNRLSCREPLGRWRAMASHWLRYKG